MSEFSGNGRNQPPKNFQRLLDDLQFDCFDFDEILDVLLDFDASEGASGDVGASDLRKHYPNAWHHLQSCERCAKEYTLWKSTILDVDFDLVPSLPTPVGAGVGNAELPWRYRLHAGLAGEPFHLRFDFFVAPLFDLLSGRLAAATRHVQSHESVAAQPILWQSLALANGELMVEVILIPTELTSHQTVLEEGNLVVRLVASQPGLIPEVLHVDLLWGSIVRSGTLDAEREVDLGVVTLHEIRPAIALPPDHSLDHSIAHSVQVAVTVYEPGANDVRHG